MEKKQKFSTIDQTVTLSATPEEVYDALLDSKKHSEMTGSPAKISAKVGGKINAWDGYISGKNLELVKGKKIVQEWMTTEWPEGYPPSRLEITLSPARGGKTLLKMVQTNVPAEQAPNYEKGWYESYWEPMESYFKKKSEKA
jgi:uncharacterized protein YndB with AHSA1/START domain